MITGSETSEHKGRQLIAFRVGEQEFCVDIESVREIRGWSLATPLPQSPSYVRGVINLRGTVLPIIDMAARLGLPSSESVRQVIIVVWIGKQLVGLLVDAVSDILGVPEDAFQATPEMVANPTNVFVSRLLTLDERLVGLISLDHILPASEAAA